MRRQLSALWNVFPTLLVSSLVLSTTLLCAQMAQPTEEIPVRLFDGPTQLALAPEATSRLGLTSQGPLSVEAQRQTELRAKLFHAPLNYQAGLNLQRSAGTAELAGGAKYFTGSASSEWLTSTYGKAHDPAIKPANDLHYHAPHIPWAGPVVLRFSQEAKAHPRVTGVLKLLSPQF